jgi:mutator protein MutT
MSRKNHGKQGFDFVCSFWYIAQKLTMKQGVDYIGVGVGAIIFNTSNRIFLAKRAKEARNESGKWEFPGGAVELGETLEHAIQREIREEYGFEIVIDGLLDVVNHFIPEEKQHWVSPTFLCRIKSGTPSILEPSKCDEVAWFGLDEIPEKLLTIASRKSLESLRKIKKYNSSCKMKKYTYPVDAVLLVGPTGVGKSPLGDSLAHHGLFGRMCHHLDFGAELRLAISNNEQSVNYSYDELNFIHGVLERGLLLENEHFPLAQKIISLFLDRRGFSQKDLLVLNGIPRHVGQARDIEKIGTIHALIVLDCTTEDVYCRIRDNIGGDRTDRADDNRDLIEKKLNIFCERTTPLVEHYQSRGSRIFRVCISGDMTAERVYQAVSSLAAADPPITLVAEPPQR